MFLVTVMHTGTTSLKKQYPEAEHRHCDEESLRRALDGEQTVTTYRDPIEVADSWKRRGWFEHEKFVRMWMEQWAIYNIITTLPNVEIVDIEDLEHHLNHVEGDDNIGEYLEDDMIGHALDCSAYAWDSKANRKLH